MKKVLGIIILLVIVASGVCAYFFPGIPYYYKCTHELYTENIWKNLPDDLPKLTEGYTDFSTGEVRITAWDDMEAERSETNDTVSWANEDETHFVSITAEALNESEDFLDRTGIPHEDLDQYCKAVKKTPPENIYELMKLMAGLTMEDFDIHNFRNSKTFYKLMKLKNEVYAGEEFPTYFYPIDGVGYRGYLVAATGPEEDLSIINIYPEKDRHKRYIIAISVTDWNEVIAAAKSIKLT